MRTHGEDENKQDSYIFSINDYGLLSKIGLQYLTILFHWRIQGGARDARPSRSIFFHFHTVFGKKFVK